MANNKCMECGCACKRCVSENDVHLHVEIENLKQRLVERDNHIVTMETNFLNEANKFPSGEIMALREELLTWQDKYKRLYDAHRRVQRVNQGLEDKLLKLVDVCETEKNTLTKDVASLSHKLADAKYTIKKLTEDNERYKSDVALAIQFLQCKQSNFVSQKIDTLPPEVQTQVNSYLNNGKKKQQQQSDENKKPPHEIKSIKVPIPTFPPTAMVYSIPKSPNASVKNDSGGGETETEFQQQQSVDIVSAAIMAKVLEERERERSMIKHCDSCTCANKTLKIVTIETKQHNIGVQTENFPITNSSTSSSLMNLNSEGSHHRFCEKFENVKGPRYCSLRVQTGSKNILLDNVDSNVAPVLYTRQNSNNNGKKENSLSLNNDDDDDLLAKNRQRVADWVETSDDFSGVDADSSSSLCGNGNGNNNNNNNGEQRLGLMEDNVKRFLFGKSEFLKTVEIGKLKYQGLMGKDGGISVHNQGGNNCSKTSRSNSHTETEI